MQESGSWIWPTSDDFLSNRFLGRQKTIASRKATEFPDYPFTDFQPNIVRLSFNGSPFTYRKCQNEIKLFHVVTRIDNDFGGFGGNGYSAGEDLAYRKGGGT